LWKKSISHLFRIIFGRQLHGHVQNVVRHACMHAAVHLAPLKGVTGVFKPKAVVTISAPWAARGPTRPASRDAYE
jgi:hypothetical protein